VNSHSLGAAAKRGVAILRFDGREWQTILRTRHSGSRFSMTFRHSEARSVPAKSLVLIATDSENLFSEPDFDEDVAWGPFGVHPEVRSLRLGLVHSIQAISTLDSRVSFDLVEAIQPSSLAALLQLVSPPGLRRGARSLGESTARYEAATQKVGEQLIRLVIAMPENEVAVRRIASRLSKPTVIRNARALQQDAVDLALKAFGLTDGASYVELPGDTALSTIRLQEDAVIDHDARSIPGWRLDSSYLTGRAIFSRDHQQLEVITANTRPLEELFGVDLIYLNQSHRALIMVQYKMMDRSGSNRESDQQWIVEIDEQFKRELRRMDIFDKDLGAKGPFRLNSGAFFLKLMKRNAGANSAGIILCLGHFKELLATGRFAGPRGGLRINYAELNGHYLRGEAFVDLVRSGYIGTRAATTDHLQGLIDAALHGGRAVVAAIQSVIPFSEGHVGHVSEIDPTKE
jgi:hypothetical protein